MIKERYCSYELCKLLKEKGFEEMKKEDKSDGEVLMKIKIKYIGCGGFGTIIDCETPKIFCPFCKERVISFEEDREVTPTELYNLLKHNYNKIILT